MPCEEHDGTTFNPLTEPRMPQNTASQTDGRMDRQTEDITPTADRTAYNDQLKKLKSSSDIII